MHSHEAGRYLHRSHAALRGHNKNAEEFPGLHVSMITAATSGRLNYLP